MESVCTRNQITFISFFKKEGQKIEPIVIKRSILTNRKPSLSGNFPNYEDIAIEVSIRQQSLKLNNRCKTEVAQLQQHCVT